MMKKLKLSVFFAFLLTIGLSTFYIRAQSHDESHNKSHEFKKFRIALILGHGFIPSATMGNDREFVTIPVWGFDFQYWFNKKWGLALKNDIEIAKYTVVDKDDHSDDIVRSNPVIISLPVLYSPWAGGLTFLLGPGIELEEHSNLFVLRMGLGYEFELPGHWDFAPEFVYDLKGGHINALTLGIGVGKRF